MSPGSCRSHRKLVYGSPEIIYFVCECLEVVRFKGAFGDGSVITCVLGLGINFLSLFVVLTMTFRLL